MPLDGSSNPQCQVRRAHAQVVRGGGLYLELSPSGGKWWRFKYRFGVDGLPAGLALPPPAQRRMAAARDSAAARISAVEVSDRRRGLFR